MSSLWTIPLKLVLILMVFLMEVFHKIVHHINFNENRRILIKLSFFITIHHEIKCSCTLGQGCDAKVLSVLSESLERWFGVQRTKTLGRTQVAHSSIDNQPPYPFIIHFESKIFKNQACTTSRGSSTRSKRQQHKVKAAFLPAVQECRG